MTLRVRYMSDLHIEHSNCNIDTSNCDVLILAGDICAYLEDFSIVLRKIPEELPVIFVLGNHEYENQHYDKVAHSYAMKTTTKGSPSFSFTRFYV